MTPDTHTPMIQEGEGAHASLQVFSGYDYDRVHREFGEQQAKVWDLVRRCHAAEQGDLPIMDAHRLDVRSQHGTYAALGASFADEGWLEFDPLFRQRLLSDLPNRVEDLSNASTQGATIESARVIVTSKPAPNVADILRAMRDERIGRPSTYAKHIEKLMAMVKHGYIAEDESKRFTLTRKGEAALTTLRQVAFPEVGIRHCVELEDDLIAIENGEATAYEIACKHLSLVMDVASAARLQERSGQAGSFSDSMDGSDRRIPVSIDPEAMLPSNHRLRRIKRAIQNVLNASSIGASNAERSTVRAMTAAESATIWNLKSDEQILEELQFNLAYRWLCGIAPEDELWTLPVYRALVREAPELRIRLAEAVREALGSSPAS